MRILSLAVAFGLVLGAACSSSGGGAPSAPPGDAGLADAPGTDGAIVTDAGATVVPSAGQGTGAPLFVSVEVLGTALSGSTPIAHASVVVRDLSASKGLDGAEVTITPRGGEAVKLPGQGGAAYEANLPAGWATSYEVSVMHPSGSRTGIVAFAPAAFTIAIDPPPKVNTASTMTWTPSGDEEVAVFVMAGRFVTKSASPLPDTGSVEVPPNAFPDATIAAITVQRLRSFIVANQLQATIALRVNVPSMTIQP